MKTSKIIRYVFLIGLLAGFIACQKETGKKVPGTPVRIFLTDHATPHFDSVFIDIQGLEVKLEDDTLPNGGWVSLQIRTGVYNILRFRNGVDTLFATGTLPGNRLRKIRLTLGMQNSLVQGLQVFPLKVKDNDRQVVIDLESGDFEILASGELQFWIDFDAARSIKVDNSGSGNNNGFELDSKIRAFHHRNTGRIEGRVLPAEARPVVFAIRDSDTAAAIPESDGRFKIVGLEAGLYNILFDGNNGYRDTLLNRVSVIRNEHTRLQDILLRQ